MKSLFYSLRDVSYLLRWLLHCSSSSLTLINLHVCCCFFKIFSFNCQHLALYALHTKKSHSRVVSSDNKKSTYDEALKGLLQSHKRARLALWKTFSLSRTLNIWRKMSSREKIFSDFFFFFSIKINECNSVEVRINTKDFGRF